MSLCLNAYPISFDKEATISACSIAYDHTDRSSLRNLREKHKDICAFYRNNDQIFCISADQKYPIEGKEVSLLANDNFNLVGFLIKDGIVKLLKEQGRNVPIGFNPIEIVSSLPADNIIKDLTNEDFPFSINCKYALDIRNIKGKMHLTIDCSTRTLVTQTCDVFLKQGFNLVGRYAVSVADDGYRKLLGEITGTSGNDLQYLDKKGETKSSLVSEIYLDANRSNFDDYARHALGNKADAFLEKVRIKVSSFNGGANKKDRIHKLKGFLSSKIQTINGIKINLEDPADLSRDSYTAEKPMLIFNDNRQNNWNDGGIKQYGPYTKNLFDRNNPSICIICSENHKGQIEQFVGKFIKGIPSHKYFSNGLEGKFNVGKCQIEVFTFSNEDVEGYRKAIEAAFDKKTQDGGKWDLALVQVKQAFKNLPVESNPYYTSKSLFLIHQVPVQDFTFELLSQNDNSLGYSLNNMALAAYAKMGGIPWLLKSSPAISHELVIGIGSAHISSDRLSASERVMGITTVFSGDGSYIVSNTSKAVSPEQYSDALTTVLKNTINKVKSRLNWQAGDSIRIVFHASVKKFNRDEIHAIKKVVDEYKEYNIEYAFLKVSEHHGLHMFDTASATEKKGKYAPHRGQSYQLSNHENLVYLIGGRELKQVSDGHPRGLILSVHRDSTFKDIKYLTAQLFNFSAHSWRSYFPSPMPVTISYSDLIAHNLGWLNKVPGWNDTVMHSKIGQTQWFL